MYIHQGFKNFFIYMFLTYSNLCLASSTPHPLYDKIICSSETFPRLYGARSTTASSAAATCNVVTVYHLSKVLSTAMQLHHYGCNQQAFKNERYSELKRLHIRHTISFKQNCGYSHEEKQVIQFYSYTRLRIQRLVVQVPPAAPIFIHASRVYQREKHIDLWECVIEDSQTHRVVGKFTSFYKNVYVKIPRNTHCGILLHCSMGMCVGKFLEIQYEIYVKVQLVAWKMPSGKLSFMLE